MVSVGDVVILGPGSEWLWTMAQFLALALTGIAILRQLRTQRSASLYDHITQWNTEWQSLSMVRTKLALLLDLQSRHPSEGVPRAADEVPDFFERVGYLVARGHINPEDFWNDGAWEVVEWYWGVLEPYIRHDREVGKFRYPQFEWLEAEMRRRDARHGQVQPPFPEAAREAEIAARIDIFRRRLEREEPGWAGARREVGERSGLADEVGVETVVGVLGESDSAAGEAGADAV